MLSRQADTLYLLFDADNAGLEATVRNSMLCLEEDIHPLIVTLGENFKDVDDFWKQHSPEDFQKRLDAAKPFMEHYLDMLVAQYNLSHVQLKRKAVDLYLDAILALQSSVEQQVYLRMAAHRLDIDSPTLYAEFQRKRDPRTKVRRGTQGTEPHVFASPSHLLMAILLTFPALSQELPQLALIDNFTSDFPNALLQFFRKEMSFETPADVLALVPEVLRKQTDMLLLYAEEHGALADQESALEVAKEKLRQLLDARKKELLQKMGSAQNAKDAKGWYEAYAQLQELQKT